MNWFYLHNHTYWKRPKYHYLFCLKKKKKPLTNLESPPHHKIWLPLNCNYLHHDDGNFKLFVQRTPSTKPTAKDPFMNQAHRQNTPLFEEKRVW